MDKKFRWPRIWSNKELKRFSHHFLGEIINVSAGTDEDKEGSFYQAYFTHATHYWISNYQMSVPNKKNEIYLDLESDLDAQYVQAYGVVFNHTTLEHVFDCRKAFKNLALLSKDIVIVVVPYIQQMHGTTYQDFWRFTPWTMQRLYEENDLKLRYCSANGADNASIYLFCIGYKLPQWDAIIPAKFDLKLQAGKALYSDNYTNVIGGNIIS